MERVASKQPVVAGERFPKTRSVPRYPIVALVEVIEPVGRARVNGWTSVISDNGCHVRAVSSLTAGTIVQLEIALKGEKFRTWARVTSVLQEEGMGLAFFDTDAAERETLKKWMEEFGTTKAI